MTNTEKVIAYVLKKAENLELTELKYTLLAAQKLYASFPSYNHDEITNALFGGNENAE